MKVGLVLGAGGVLGGAWITGALEAVARKTGWDPASADHIVGTSAGSMMGALVAAGVPPWFMVAHSAGEDFDGLTDAHGEPVGDADRNAGARFYFEGGVPIGPGSWGLALRTLIRPHRHTPAALLGGWLPRGFISTGPLKDTVRSAVPTGWADHPNLWIMACDYSTGRRVAFGRDGAPPAELADAVAASCSIPGFYRPVDIGGRRYVDGGLYSNSNLDVLRAEQLDLVICLNPTSSLHPMKAWNPVERLAAMFRTEAGRRLGSEAKKLRATGTEVVLIQPTDEDLAIMGPNLMSSKRRHEVIEAARVTVGGQLRDEDTHDLLSTLPPGEAHRIRRPDGPPASWPPLVAEPTAGVA